MAIALLWCALAVASCEGAHDSVTAPSAVTQPILASTQLPIESQPNWRGEALVTTVTLGRPLPCGWGTTLGDTRSVLWRITIDGSSVTLDEDMGNWPTDDVPYKGSLNGLQFVATYNNGDDYLRYACQFKGGTLTGTFNADFSTFEAVETLVWGPPDGETTVQRHWTARRL